MTDKPTTVAEYAAALPPEVQPVLAAMRDAVRAAVPDGVEGIGYGIPCVRLDGRILVYFAAWKHHVSVYPVPDTDDQALVAEMEQHRDGKGTLKFPLGEPVPYDLITRVAEALVDQRDRGQA
jgi:uncharacterized protein YdhG (YjbR/CyaY superfamily)